MRHQAAHDTHASKHVAVIKLDQHVRIFVPFQCQNRDPLNRQSPAQMSMSISRVHRLDVMLSKAVAMAVCCGARPEFVPLCSVRPSLVKLVVRVWRLSHAVFCTNSSRTDLKSLAVFIFMLNFTFLWLQWIEETFVTFIILTAHRLLKLQWWGRFFEHVI